VYDTRLTDSRFLGDVHASREGDTLLLRGVRAEHDWIVTRFVAQWSVAALALVALAFGFEDWVLPLLAAALLVSLVGYVWMWAAAPEESVRIPLSSLEGVHVGWVWRPQDILFVGSLLAILDLNRASSRTLSFHAPDASGSRPMQFILQARSSRDLVRLAGVLDKWIQ
jgi:hypothetical protein